MGKIHFSLNRRVNVVFIALWGLGALLILTLARPRPFLAASIGAALGLLAGSLQRASIRVNPSLFAQAKTDLEVRRLFMSNRPGKVSIALEWTSIVVSAIVGLVGPGRLIVAIGVSFLSFLFSRDLVAFGAIRSVEGPEQSGQHAF